MGYLDDVLATTRPEDLLAQQSPAVRDALAEALNIPEDPRIQGYRSFTPPLPAVPGKAPRLTPRGLDEIFANDAPQMAGPPQATRYQPKLAQFANQMQYRMPMQGLGSIMMRRR